MPATLASASTRTGYTRAVAVTGVANIVASAMATALLLPALVRNAGLDSYGVWSLLALFIPLAALVQFGCAGALIYFVARSPAHARSYLRWAAVIVGTVFAIVTLGLLLPHVHGDGVVGGMLAARPLDATWVLGTGLIVTFLQAMTGLLRAVLEANDAADRNNIGFGLLTVGQYAATSTVAWIVPDVRALFATSVVVYALIFVLHVCWARPYLRKPASLPPASPSALRSYASRTFAYEVLPVGFVPLMLLLVARNAHSAGDYAVFDISWRIATMAASAVALVSVPIFAAAARAMPGQVPGVRADAAARIGLALGAGLVGWITYRLVGMQLLDLIGLAEVSAIHRTSTTLMAGAVVMSAMESVIRLRLGMASIAGPFVAWLVTVVTASVASLALHSLAVLERFSLSMLAGHLAGASVLALLLWRHPGHQGRNGR